jgi:hypothetical protein
MNPEEADVGMPNEMSPINLSRALKLKNRVVHRLAQLDALIIAYNSTAEDNQEYDVRELYKSRTNLVRLLVDLKSAINAANQPVQKVIFELAECKSLIAMLNKVNTKNGPTLEGYAGVRVNYVAQLRKSELDRETKRIEQAIDRLQDELDRFNYKTLITIDRSTFMDEEPVPGVFSEA